MCLFDTPTKDNHGGQDNPEEGLSLQVTPQPPPYSQRRTLWQYSPYSPPNFSVR